MSNDTQILTTTETSITILEFIQNHDQVRVDDIADFLEVSRGTVYKHISTLMKHGFVVNKGDEYLLGGRLYDLGMHVRTHDKTYRLAGECVVTLANKSNEEADFAIEQNGRLVTLFDWVSGSTKPSSRREYYQYLHTTSIGKAILAKYSDERIRDEIDRWGLPRVTENTITSREELFRELETVRENGYAINNQESRSGKRAIGMAVEHPSGNVIGGFSICGPEYRISDLELHQDLSNVLTEGVEEFKRELETQNLP